MQPCRPIDFAWTVAVLSAIVPAVVLGGAGFGKEMDPEQTGVFLSSTIGLPFALAVDAGRMIGWSEILLSLSIIFSMGRSMIPAIVGIVVMGVFFGLLLFLFLTASNVACGCYGAILGIWFPKSIPSQMAVDVAVALMLGGHLVAVRAVAAVAPRSS